MAFPRVALKNEIEALGTLASQLSSINDAINILKSKTLDGSRAVAFNDLNLVYTGLSPRKVPVFRLKVAGAIFLTTKSNAGDKDACVIAKHPIKEQFYTVCGHATHSSSADLLGMKTPILKPHVRVFMRRANNGSADDQVNYYPVFIPTLDSDGTSISDFIEIPAGGTELATGNVDCTTTDIRDILM